MTIKKQLSFPSILIILLSLCFMEFLIVAFSATRLSAQDSYSWKEPGGKVVYGSKPPANAREVKKFKTRQISTYSSTKASSRSKVGTTDDATINNADKDSHLYVEGEQQGEVFQDEKSAKISAPKSRSIISGQLVQLKAQLPVLKANLLNEVTFCQVEVINEGEVGAQDVSVAFEFFDGTLIPAAGPFTIPAKGKAIYSIPETLLPLHLAVGDAPEGEDAIPVPRVVVHGASY